MVKIDKHISDLLFRYDCVIVPDLGGFVANYAPAKIHPTQHTFDPPSKNIVFNKNLRNNDGLLANHISGTEQKTYNEATTIIHQYVEDCNTQLRSGKRIKIEKVGDLFLNVERNIQFEPDRSVNYLTEAFGLTPFQSPAIKRGGHVERIEKEFKDRVIPETHTAPKRKVNIKRYVAMAVTLPLVFAMVWIPLKTDLLKNVNYSNLNPFANREKALYAERNISNNEAAFFSMADFSTETSVFNDNTSPVVNVKLGESNIPVRLKQDTISVEEKQDNTAVAVNTSENKSLTYHIVAGCFKITENATNFVKQLKAKNFIANIIGQNENGLHIVSVGDYATKEEAERALIQMRSSNQEVWVMKK